MCRTVRRAFAAGAIHQSDGTIIGQYCLYELFLSGCKWVQTRSRNAHFVGRCGRQDHSRYLVHAGPGGGLIARKHHTLWLVCVASIRSVAASAYRQRWRTGASPLQVPWRCAIWYLEHLTIHAQLNCKSPRTPCTCSWPRPLGNRCVGVNHFPLSHS